MYAFNMALHKIEWGKEMSANGGTMDFDDLLGRIVKETNNYITKYYIYGTIEKSTINQSDEAKDYYIIVYLDSQNMTFAVEPYDGEIFND